MSESKQIIALYSGKLGRWHWLPVADGCSASTEPLVPDVSNTEEFRRAASFRKKLLTMPIIGIRERLEREFGHPQAYVNRMKYNNNLPLPWRARRYYLGYDSHVPPYRAREINRHHYQPIRVDRRNRKEIAYLLKRGPVADFFRNMPKAKGGRS